MQTKKQQYLLLLMAVLAACFTILLYGEVSSEPVGAISSVVSSVQVEEIKPVSPVVESNSEQSGLDSAPKTKKNPLSTVTCFSSVECHSAWCQANKGKPRGLKAAVDNAHMKAYSKLYIAQYDKTYEIIKGAPSSGTDIDIWTGDDGEAAQACGRHDLMIKWIR